MDSVIVRGEQYRMLRNSVIVFLTLASITGGAVGAASFELIPYRHLALGERFWVYFYCSEGIARVYWFTSDEPIRLEHRRRYENMYVRRASDGAICHRYRHGAPKDIIDYALLWRQVSPVQGRSGLPRVYMHGIRTQVMLPVALLIAYPVWAIVGDRLIRRLRRRRVKGGLCAVCGYDLTGNVTGVCSECGTPVTDICSQCGYALGGITDAACPWCGQGLGDRPPPAPRPIQNADAPGPSNPSIN